MTGAPSHVPVYKPHKSASKDMFKLRTSHCCESCLEQERGLICFEHRLLPGSRHGILLAICGRILEPTTPA